MTEQELHHVQLAQSGKQIGFNYLVNQYWQYVYSFIFKRTKNEYLTEEVCIESFAKAFDKINQFNSQYEFKTWLVQIAKNHLIDEYRKKSINTQELTHSNLKIAEESNLEETQAFEKNKEQVLIELKKLHKDYQAVIEKFYFEAKSFKEISTELDIPINNLKVKAFRAKQKLQKALTK